MGTHGDKEGGYTRGEWAVVGDVVMERDYTWDKGGYRWNRGMQ